MSFGVVSGEWGLSRDRCIRWEWRSSTGRGSFGVDVGHLIVTNGDLCIVIRGGDAALPKLRWDFLLLLSIEKINCSKYILCRKSQSSKMAKIKMNAKL